MPLSGDFTVFGGLYRDVNIIAVDTIIDSNPCININFSTIAKNFFNSRILSYIINYSLWNGVADPYLYNVKVFLYDESNNLKDIVYKKIGFRFYYVDENEGFFLNGKSYQNTYSMH